VALREEIGEGRIGRAEEAEQGIALALAGGFRLRLAVTATNAVGSTSALSAPTDVVP